MNILSLFDGMSCGQIALRELVVAYDTYYASEIDRHAIAQTQLNFPATVQLGDVTAWRTWNIPRWGDVDLILAGSPCQGFSCAGRGLAFDDTRSRLFFCFADILHHAQRHNPAVKFLLENVRMKSAHRRVISEAVGVQPVTINSTLVSAQNRVRCYWTNIRTRREGLFGELHADIPQPDDREILLEDILEENEAVDKKYFLRGKTLERILRENPKINADKAYCVSPRGSTCGYGHAHTMTVVSANGKARRNQGKATCLNGVGGHGAGNYSRMDVIVQRKHGYNKGGIFEQKSPSLTGSSFEQNNLIMQLNPSRESNGRQPYQQNRVFDNAGKSPTHMADMSTGSYAVCHRGALRRLTPTECARLQTVPAWYRWACSDTQQYRMLGNGWTIEVIKHILGFLPTKN